MSVRVKPDILGNAFFVDIAYLGKKKNHIISGECLIFFFCFGNLVKFVPKLKPKCVGFRFVGTVPFSESGRQCKPKRLQGFNLQCHDISKNRGCRIQ